ncbi:MAG: hypothetical protein IBJ03_19625 [Gemmatimonadaceae bacterium]|nr:hypothetical protein [Gemmatimonadaceae bacterium]
MLVELPSWASVSPKRHAHITRVTDLLDRWSVELGVDSTERMAWHDAGRWHDALRDLSEDDLRAATGDMNSPVGLLHGPAAADRLAREGEKRIDVLEAIRWHTVGHASWSRTGRALYMADFLEPGRPFMQADRAYLADRVAASFDDTFRQVVRLRLEWTLREGKQMHPPTVALWNSVC